MSMEALTQVISSVQLSPSARLLLLVIAYHIHPTTGSTVLSTRQLVAETGLSLRHLQHLLGHLEASGALVIERGGGRGDAQVYRMPSTGAMGIAVPTAKGSAGVRTPAGREFPLPTAGPCERTTGDPPRALGREGSPRLDAPACVPAKRCGWGGCEELVCPHEVNFCARHACCQACAAPQPSIGSRHGGPPAGPDARPDPVP